jgi:hypothetical protein
VLAAAAAWVAEASARWRKQRERVLDLRVRSLAGRCLPPGGAATHGDAAEAAALTEPVVRVAVKPRLLHRNCTTCLLNTLDLCN